MRVRACVRARVCLGSRILVVRTALRMVSLLVNNTEYEIIEGHYDNRNKVRRHYVSINILPRDK